MFVRIFLRKISILLPVFLLLGILVASHAYAQTSGATLPGTVTDQSRPPSKLGRIAANGALERRSLWLAPARSRITTGWMGSRSTIMTMALQEAFWAAIWAWTQYRNFQC